MITVLMPLYNCREYAALAVKSILNQTFREFEFLIIDDGSTDGSGDIIKSFRDKRINYCRREHGGLSNTLNFGLNKARYDIIARMDSDDLAAPGRLEKQVKYFMQQNCEMILSCWYAIFRDRNIECIIRTPVEHEAIKERLLLHSDIIHSGALFRKSTLLNAGGYKGDVYEDYDLWLRLKDRVLFHNIPEVLMFQRLRNDSLSWPDKEKRRIHYSIQSPYYEDMGKNFGILSSLKQYEYRAWREFFYGDKTLAGKYWMKMGLSILIHPRAVLAFLISWLPYSALIFIKRHSIKYCIIYSLSFLSKSNSSIRRTLLSLLN